MKEVRIKSHPVVDEAHVSDSAEVIENALVSAHKNLRTALFCTLVNFSGLNCKTKVNFMLFAYCLQCNCNKYANDVSENMKSFSLKHSIL